MRKVIYLLFSFYFLFCAVLSAGVKEIKADIKAKDYDSAEAEAVSMLGDKNIKNAVEVKLLLISIYEKTKRYDEGIKLGEELVKDELPKNPDKAYLALARAYEKAKRHLKGIEVLKVFIGKYAGHKKEADMYMKIGMLYQKMKQQEEAKEAFDYIVKNFADKKIAERAQKKLDKMAGQAKPKPKKAAKKKPSKPAPSKKAPAAEEEGEEE